MPVPRPYNPEGLKVGIAMIGDLKKIGITARIVSYDWGTYLKRQREQPEDMDMFQLGWTGDNGDPDNFLAVLFDGLASPAIRTQWKNEDYHKLMLDGKQTVDQQKRAGIYKQAQQGPARRDGGGAHRPFHGGVAGPEKRQELQAASDRIGPHEERLAGLT